MVKKVKPYQLSVVVLEDFDEEKLTQWTYCVIANGIPVKVKDGERSFD